MMSRYLAPDVSWEFVTFYISFILDFFDMNVDICWFEQVLT